MVNLLIGIASILNLVLTVITLQKNSKSLSNISFALLSLVMGIWALLFIPYNISFLDDSLIWIKAIYLLVIVMVGAMVFFGYSFPYGDKPNWKVLLLYSVLNLPIIYMLIFTNLFVQAVEMTPFGPETVVGPYYWYGSLVWSTSGLGTAIYHLVKKFKKATGIAKYQLLYMFLGLSIFGVAAAFLDGVIPIFLKTSRYFSLSAIFSLFFVGLTTYSIVRHRLLDIRIAIQESVVFLITTLLISTLFILGAVAYWIFTKQEIKFSVLPVIFFLSSILTLLYERFSFFSKLIAKHVFSLSAYDYQKTLRDFSLNLSFHPQLQSLIAYITQALTDIFKLKKIAFLIYEKQKGSCTVEKTSGFGLISEDGSRLLCELISTHLAGSAKIIVLEEIKKLRDELRDETEKNNLMKIAQLMEEGGVSLVIPLITNDSILGVIILGDKISLDPYTVQDINFLNTIAYEASVAFQNAKSYEEIQRFNFTLKEQIDQATEDLQSANEKLKALDHLKDDFVSIASHELRTPMTAIRSYAWMALHRSDVPLSKILEKYLVRVLISTERLINLVNDMLNVSRIEAGKIEISPEPVDLLLLIKDIVDEVYYSKSEEKKIQFVVLEKKIPKVLADPEKLRQVFLNLVGNSLKFTPNEGKITFDFFSDGKVVEVSVSDTGVGISKEDISKLFHKFSRLDNAYTAAATSGGTGLGLYISKSLVELMHGRIWAISEGTNKGSTFKVSLAVATPDIIKDIDKYRVKPVDNVKGLESVAI